MSQTIEQHEQAHHYTCPHCGSVLEVPDSLLGETIECPHCDGQVNIETPNAKAADAGDTTPSKIIRVPTTASNEDKLLVVNPAMFRRYPLRFCGYIAAILLAGGGAAMLFLSNQPVTGGLLALVGLIPLAIFVYWYLQIQYTTLTITNKRSIYREGVIAKQTSEVLHDDVRNLQSDQNVWERIVGIGDLAISSSGQDGMEIDIDGIPNPDRVTSLIRSFQD